MKKYIVCIIILCLSLLLTGCKNKKKSLSDLDIIKKRGYLIAGVKTDSPPFGFYDKDQVLSGIDIELAYAIANEIFQNDSPGNVEFKPVTSQNRIEKLNSKEVDILVATMSVNDKRKLVLDFSIPYFSASQKIMVKKDSKISHLSYFNTKGKLAVVLGTTGEKILHLAAPNARIIGTKTYTEAVDYLKKSDVDAILGDDCILSGLNNGKFKIINRAYSKEYYAVALRKSPQSEELLNSVNTTITAYIDSKKINTLKKRFIKNDYRK